MLEILWSIAPIFVLILLGHFLYRKDIPGGDFWAYNDRLVYWVFIPALLFFKISTIKLSGDLVADYAIVVIGGFAAATLFALIALRGITVSGAAASSVLQGAVRHNTYIGLAVAESLYGDEGLALAALATSLLIPVTNLVVISGMTVMTGSHAKGGLLGSLARDLARNPLVLAVLLGLGYNLAGLGPLPVLHDTTDILGRAALPVVLLCVGANIRFEGLRTSVPPFAVAAIGKLVVFPAVVVGLILLTGLHGAAAVVAVIYGALPTAPSAFALARQMGGDAPLMAGMITLQTLIAFVAMPLTIVVADMAFR